MDDIVRQSITAGNACCADLTILGTWRPESPATAQAGEDLHHVCRAANHDLGRLQ